MDFCVNKNYKINFRGFTLIELLITIAIMAILAAIVAPNFSSQIIRGKLTDSVDQLAQLRLAMERQFQNTGTYLNTGGDACGITMPADNNFTFTCTASDTAYTLTASNADNKGLGDADTYEYTINEAGTMQTTKYPGNDTAKNCWLIQQNDC
jgi:type IV pilus assembly protein PilE